MNKEKLDNFKEAMKPMIDQNLEGLLYDLDLLPEQLNTECDGKRYSAIVNQHSLIKSLKNCENCKHKFYSNSEGKNKCNCKFTCKRELAYSGGVLDNWELLNTY
jgi:hypothetical protein